MLQFNFNPFPVLTTERLVLRLVTQADANEMFFLRSDDEVMRYIERPKATTTEDAVKFIDMIIKNIADNSGITWGISLKNNNTLIGYLGFWQMRPEHHRGETGYALHPAHQRKGIAGEALKAILDYGFKAMKLHSVEANVNPGNAASIRLLERIGFVREAYFKEDFYWNGQFLDSAIYSLLTPIHQP